MPKQVPTREVEEKLRDLLAMKLVMPGTHGRRIQHNGLEILLQDMRVSIVIEATLHSGEEQSTTSTSDIAFERPADADASDGCDSPADA